MDAELRFIGKIKSKLTSLTSCPKQGREGAPQARVEIFSEFRDALKGMTPGKRLVILTWLFVHPGQTCRLNSLVPLWLAG